MAVADAWRVASHDELLANLRVDVRPPLLWDADPHGRALSDVLLGSASSEP